VPDVHKYIIKKKGKNTLKKKLRGINLTSLSTKWRSTQTGDMKIKNNTNGL